MLAKFAPNLALLHNNKNMLFGLLGKQNGYYVFLCILEVLSRNSQNSLIMKWKYVFRDSFLRL